MQLGMRQEELAGVSRNSDSSSAAEAWMPRRAAAYCRRLQSVVERGETDRVGSADTMSERTVRQQGRLSSLKRGRARGSGSWVGLAGGVWVRRPLAVADTRPIYQCV
jgi:hypothetical protein